MKQFLLINAAGLFILCVIALPNWGIGDGGERLPVVPVEGQVVINGKPIPGAVVVFHPQGTPDPRHFPARATTDANGAFRLTTYDMNDGAPQGEYVVTVLYYPTIQQGDRVVPGPNVMPSKHISPATSDLRIRVADGDNKLPPISIKL